MRRQLTALVAATTTLVLLAFLLPLSALVRNTARDDAVAQAAAQTQALVPLVGQAAAAEIADGVSTVATGTGNQVTVFLGDGQVLGAAAETDERVEAAAAGRAVAAFTSSGYVIDQPVLGRPDGPAVIQVIVPDAQLNSGVTRAWVVLGGLGLALLALALIVADRLARRLTRPISELAETAGRLETGDLSARVQPAGPDEVREVGRALNRLAARIGELLRAERESVADLSHRLRTPLTALRLDAESLANPEERGQIIEDADDLERRVDDLIQEARRPVREGLGAASDAGKVVRERVEFWRILAEDQQREIELELAETVPLLVRASEADLDAALDALLGNVFAHTPEGTSFAVRLAGLDHGGCSISVEDAGPGLRSEEVAERGISGSGSTGLGLDIARRTARASGGGLELGRSPMGGALVKLVLGPPLAD